MSGSPHLLLLSDAFHKNVWKAASRAQSQLDDKKSHRVEDILNKWVFSFFLKQERLGPEFIVATFAKEEFFLCKGQISSLAKEYLEIGNYKRFSRFP